MRSENVFAVDHDVGVASTLPSDRGGYVGMRVADRGDSDAREKVEMALAVARMDPGSLRSVDVEAARVYVPDEGWLTVEEFGEIYFNDADRLPGHLHFEEHGVHG